MNTPSTIINRQTLDNRRLFYAISFTMIYLAITFLGQSIQVLNESTLKCQRAIESKPVELGWSQSFARQFHVQNLPPYRGYDYKS